MSKLTRETMHHVWREKCDISIDRPVFAWYLSHSITPIAINPTNSQITINNQQYAAISSVTRLEDPKNTSISIVTPPGVTMNVLREASHAGVKSVWLQPGSFDDAGLRFAMEKLPNAAVGGTDGGGHEGWCVLVDGEASMPAKVGRGVL